MTTLLSLILLALFATSAHAQKHGAAYRDFWGCPIAGAGIDVGAGEAGADPALCYKPKRMRPASAPRRQCGLGPELIALPLLGWLGRRASRKRLMPAYEKVNTT